MKLFNLKQILATTGLMLCSCMVFADSPATTGDATDIGNLLNFSTIFMNNGQVILKLTVIIATLAGLILIVKGLVHLKQNYTGTGQEKHLSKGIASLGFGTALLLAVPLSHTLVSSFSTQTDANYSTGTTGAMDFDNTSGKLNPNDD